MSSLDPTQARFLLNSAFLPGLDAEHHTTMRVIQAIPLDKGDYRPDDVSMTSLGLAHHLVGAELWFIDAVCRGEFDLSARSQPETVKNSADLAAWYSQQFAVRREALTKVPDESLAKILDFKGVFQLPAVFFVNFAIGHSIHHRGQLSVYLRPMGARVPGIYGESFDSAQARKAAQKQ